MRKHSTARLAALTAAAALAVGAAGCSSSDKDSTASSSSSSSAAATSGASSASSSSGVSVTDPWIKATDGDMTAAFGTIDNQTDKAVHIVSATAGVDGMVQLHETSQQNGQSVMQEAKDGFTIPAKGRLTLDPGGNHVMIMGLKAPITPGQDVDVTLKADDGTTIVMHCPGRAFSGANETYAPDGNAVMSSSAPTPGGDSGMAGMADHDMSGMPGMSDGHH